MTHIEHIHKLLYRLLISKEFKLIEAGWSQTDAIIHLGFSLTQDLQVVHRTNEEHANEAKSCFISLALSVEN